MTRVASLLSNKSIIARLKNRDKSKWTALYFFYQPSLTNSSPIVNKKASDAKLQPLE
jgi:hypothetical protein